MKPADLNFRVVVRFGGARLLTSPAREDARPTETPKRTTTNFRERR